MVHEDDLRHLLPQLSPLAAQTLGPLRDTLCGVWRPISRRQTPPIDTCSWPHSESPFHLLSGRIGRPQVASAATICDRIRRLISRCEYVRPAASVWRRRASLSLACESQVDQLGCRAESSGLQVALRTRTAPAIVPPSAGRQRLTSPRRQDADCRHKDCRHADRPERRGHTNGHTNGPLCSPERATKARKELAGR